MPPLNDDGGGSNGTQSMDLPVALLQALGRPLVSVLDSPQSQAHEVNSSLRPPGYNPPPPWHLLADTLDREMSPPAAPPDPYTDIVEALHQYYVPVMIVMGLVGNLLSCIVFLNTHLRLRSSSYYLAALASADLGYLAVLVLVWLNSMHGVQVFNKEGWCQVITYVSSVCAFLSVWLIVAFTVERFIAVQYPLHRPHMCTVARAKAIVACIAIFALVAHIYTLKTRGMVRDKDGYESCEMLDQHRDMMRIINLVDAIVTLVVPIILIIVMNTMITRNLVLFGRRFKQASPEQQVSWADGNVGNETASSGSSSSSNRRSQQLSGKVIPGGRGKCSKGPADQVADQRDPAPAAQRHLHSESRMALVRPKPPIQISTGRTLVSTRTQQSITKMLLLISSVFIVLNLPSHVLRVYASIAMFTGSNVDMSTSPALWFGQQLAMLLYYTNFSINFLLYSMCGITFRRCLWQLMRSTGRYCGFGCGSRWSDCHFR